MEHLRDDSLVLPLRPGQFTLDRDGLHFSVRVLKLSQFEQPQSLNDDGSVTCDKPRRPTNRS